MTETSPSAVCRSRSRDARRLPPSERHLVEQIEQALDLLQGKWKVRLVFLMARGIHRHCNLLEVLQGASKKVMTDTAAAWLAQGDAYRRAGDADAAMTLFRRAAEALQDFRF